MYKRYVFLAVCIIAAGPADALEIDSSAVPEINIGGRAIASVGYLANDRAVGGAKEDSVLDISDSSLLFGFSKYLFQDNTYGYAVFGFKLPDDDAGLKDDIYAHQMHVGVGGPRYEVKLGRSRLGNTLISFPIVRDDDLLSFTHVLNGSSNAKGEEYQLFGGVVQGKWWFQPMVMLDATLTARTHTNAAGAPIHGGEFNGYHVGVAYDMPEAAKADRGLRYAGLRLDSQRAQALGVLGRDTVTAVTGAVSYNLNSNPEATWGLDVQALHNDGPEVPSLASFAERARARSTSVVVAVRYGDHPALQTRWQAALTLAWKRYGDFDEATSYAVAPSFIRRLGGGVDFTAQYIYIHNDTTLAAATNLDSHQEIKLGLVFAFDTTFNESVGERDAILNLEHGTLDVGPGPVGD